MSKKSSPTNMNNAALPEVKVPTNNNSPVNKPDTNKTA